MWDGGYGIKWAEDAARKFEADNAETSFEEGKKGVQITVEPSKSLAQDGAATNLKNLNYEIVFTEQSNYYDFIKNNAALDITEWVTTPLSEYGESKSITDKMRADDVEYYAQSAAKPQYYGIPWYVAFPSINYDVTLFEDNCYYFAAEGQGDKDGFINDANTPKSLGPDGKTGVIDGVDYSIDDGMPATFDEFFVMCDKMVDDGVVPFIWTGSVQSYVNNLFTALTANIEGYDAMNLNYTFEGTASDLIASINEGVIAYDEAIEISATNGYELRRQEGKYQALKFLQRLIATQNDDGTPKYYNYADCFGQSTSHLAAQTKFLQSKYRTDTPIAMLVDGTWWYAEAGATFNAMSGYQGASQKDRKLGILCLPQPEAGKEKATTLVSAWTTSAVARKNMDVSKIKVARAFFRYLHTDEQLSKFMVTANGIRPYNFDLTNVSENDLSAYTLQQYKMYQNYETVNPYSTAPIVRNYLTSLTNDYTTIVNGKSYTLVTDAFNSGVTAEEYFLGMQTYMTEQSWRSKFLTGVIE